MAFTNQNDKTATEQPATASCFTTKSDGKSPRKERGTLHSGLGAKNSDAVTDHYLARLADRHKMKLGTLDGNIAHPAVELIA